jgi:hypothetical protein
MKLSKYYLPGSSLASRPSNVYGTPRNTLNDDQGGLRVDAAISNHQQMFGEFFQQNSPTDQPGLYPLSGLLYSDKAALAMLQHTWSVTPHAVNTIPIAFVRTIAVGGNEAQDQGPILDSAGIMNAFDNRGISAINLQGYSSFGRSNGEVGNRDNTWHMDEALNYVWRNHTFKFGVGLGYRRGVALERKCERTGHVELSTDVHSAIDPQCTRSISTAGKHRQLLGRFPAWVADKRYLIGAVGSAVSRDAVSPIRAGHLEDHAESDTELRIAVYLETPPDPHGWARKAVHGFDFETGLLTYAAPWGK